MHLTGAVRIARLRVALFTAVAACVLVGLLPFAEGSLATEGSLRSVPSYWYQPGRIPERARERRSHPVAPVLGLR